MSQNWRSEADYDYIKDLDASGLAWECLRRNPRYRNAFATMSDAEAADWGLRFPGRSRAARNGRAPLLEAHGRARRFRPCVRHIR
ncbi:transcriptional regulator domain-containing protein [Roseobacter weihaiensis]|uniref:transcriptional regulator domain-containing protein n=1 Tax=Roseobacter weihaiensis TaxID=2763262 RepID=UPI001D0B0C55|nr:DUF6499 domain-containing protein [Roseobacter sp. H9]